MRGVSLRELLVLPDGALRGTSCRPWGGVDGFGLREGRTMSGTGRATPEFMPDGSLRHGYKSRSDRATRSRPVRQDKAFGL